MGTTTVAEPAWDIATLFPPQGSWDEGDYLEVTRHTRRLVELVEGRVEILPMPTWQHQLIVRFLFQLFYNGFIRPRNLGEMIFAPLRVRLGDRLYREPDLVFLKREHLDRAGNEYWEGADLVVEVVSPEGRRRDLEDKRRDYARAGIPEYWIVDPEQGRIYLLELRDGAYHQHGPFGEGESVESILLPGLKVVVSEVMAAGSRPA